MFLWVFPLVIFAIIAAFVGLWLWTLFLDTARPPSARLAMHIFLAVVCSLEFFIWWRDNLRDWAFWCVMFCNFWGMFDAILRFPTVHELDSFFSLKMIVLVALKTMTYAVGFKNMGKNAILFLGCLFGCVWSMPLLYVMALPIGDSRMAHARTDCRDVDVLLKIYIFCSQQESEYRNDMRDNMIYLRDTALSQLAKVPGMAPVLVRANLVDRRVLRRPGREI
ncbi:unnamed protein product [Amoebophrya sp. A25]|nr:unnamed protein product [Amoebophrya sp. A25]|eukprot:GSA25T00000792001.1